MNRFNSGGAVWQVLLVAAVMVLVAAVAFAEQADKGKDKDHGPKRVIHGKPADRHAVEMLMDESDGDVEVDIDLAKKTVKEVRGKFRIDKSKPVEEAAVDFIDRHRNAFGLKNPKAELKKDPREGLYFQQIYNSVPVWGHSLAVHFNQDYNISYIQSYLIPTPDIDTTPLVTAEEALNIAKANRKIPPDTKLYQLKAELVIYKNVLAYQVLLQYWRFIIDAKAGNIINKESMLVE